MPARLPERLWAMIAAITFAHPCCPTWPSPRPAPTTTTGNRSPRSKSCPRQGRRLRARDLLIGRYQTRLRRWAHGRLPLSARGAHETHDLVQDTLLQVLNNLHKFNPRHEGAFQGFVRIILANRIRDLARKWSRRGIAEPIEGDELPGHGQSPLDEAIGTEIRSRTRRATPPAARRPRAHHRAIELGLPYKEMVEMFHKPSVSAVTMAVSRAVVRLAQEMAHA